MKKFIFMLSVVCITLGSVNFLFNNAIAQDDGSLETTPTPTPNPDDPDSLTTVEQVEAALGAAREKLSEAGFSFKLLQKIKKLEGRLIDLTVDGDGAKPTKCASLIDQISGRTDKAIQQVTNKICPDTAQRIDVTFHPLFEHCNFLSPNFQSCVCMHHPGNPGCGGGNGGGSQMAMPSEPCLSELDALNAISDLQRARDALMTLKELDANVNNVPDLCEKTQGN